MSTGSPLCPQQKLNPLRIQKASARQERACAGCGGVCRTVFGLALVAPVVVTGGIYLAVRSERAAAVCSRSCSSSCILVVGVDVSGDGLATDT